jgi:hypothetical protein
MVQVESGRFFLLSSQGEDNSERIRKRGDSMAVTHWKDKNEYEVQLQTKSYFFELADNENGTRRVLLKEWNKTRGLKKPPTGIVMIHENHMRDVVRGLLKVSKRLGLDVRTMILGFIETEELKAHRAVLMPAVKDVQGER